MVLCVGSHSTRGVYDSSLENLQGKTELALKLYNLSKSFTYLGCLFALVILGTGIAIQIIQTGVNDEIGGAVFVKKLMENLTLAVIVLVVFIPEGLPMTIDVSIGYSTIRMFERNKVLVKNIQSLEKSG